MLLQGTMPQKPRVPVTYMEQTHKTNKSLLGFGMGTILANFHMCDIMLLLSAVLNIFVRNASPRGPCGLSA